jgi:hypothetical protein
MYTGRGGYSSKRCYYNHPDIYLRKERFLQNRESELNKSNGHNIELALSHRYKREYRETVLYGF